MRIDAPVRLEDFRRFLIRGCTAVPKSYGKDRSVFAERAGYVQVEAADKVTLRHIRDVTFVRAYTVQSIAYRSKSRHTSITWKSTIQGGRLRGNASSSMVIGLAESRVLDADWIEDHIGRLGRRMPVMIKPLK